MTKTPRPTWISETLNSAERKLLRDCLLAAVGVAVITLAGCCMGMAEPAPGRELTTTASMSSRLKISQSTDAHGNGIVIGRRPAGCPRAHCGCSTSIYIFGKIKPELNLAANWLKFPRTSPASGMVAARRGHVMVLLSHVEGNEWLTYDPNSGGGLTRQHIRSIRGYRVVNPHGSYASR